MKHVYLMTLAGYTLRCAFEFPETAGFFGSWLLNDTEQSEGLAVTEGFWESWIRDLGPRNACSEYSAFSMVVSDALLAHERCLIHGAAIRFKGRAWLIAGPSGVGKSTQVRTLMALYPGEISVICGDRPVLERTDDGRIIVHPSPWNGKEGWQGAPAAPLAGILCLRRGFENKVESYSTKKAAAPVYASILQTAESEETIRRAAAFESFLLKGVPVWRLTNKGVPDSSRLLYQTMLQECDT